MAEVAEQRSPPVAAGSSCCWLRHCWASTPDIIAQLGLTQASGTEQGNRGNGPSTIRDCKTGANANARADCRILATTQSLDSFWLAYLPQYDVQVKQPGVEVFGGCVDTACGPADRTAYLDTGFFVDLSGSYGADGGPLAEEYVVAHEHGHHVQNTIGTLAASPPGGAPAPSRAPCAWNSSPTAWPGCGPGTRQTPKADLRSGLSAASAVGDDRIQQAATGQVNPEGWTHGSSAQRQAWFLQGYSTKDINKCDTLSAANLDKPCS